MHTYTFVLLLLAGALWAQVPGGFRQVNIDGGGWFAGMVQHSSGRVYGRTDVGGVYRTDNFGNQWTFLSGDFTTSGSLLVQGIAVAKGNRNMVYQAVGTSYFQNDPGRGIWKSTNNGNSWGEVTRAGFRFGNANDVSVDPHGSGQV